MTKEYEEKLIRERKELAERREKYEAEMLVERDRIISLFQKRGIPLAERRPLDRVVKIENIIDHGCLIESTYFQIPEDIDLEQVVKWFVHDTKFGECTVFLKGCPPTTIRDDYNIDYFFRHLKLGWF